MHALRKAIPITKSLIGTNALQVRNSTISGPARFKISGMEKGVLCAIIGVGVCAYPAWILSNIKNYRGAADE